MCVCVCVLGRDECSGLGCPESLQHVAGDEPHDQTAGHVQTAGPHQRQHGELPGAGDVCACVHWSLCVYKTCLCSRQKELATNVTLEQGKTLADAEGDVMRGLRESLAPPSPVDPLMYSLVSCAPAEVVEHACSITSLHLGETLSSVTKDMDTYTYREPLGVCAGVCPFNFPAMIPLWVGPVTSSLSLPLYWLCLPLRCFPWQRWWATPTSSSPASRTQELA